MYRVLTSTVFLFAAMTVSLAQAQLPPGAGGDRYIRIAQMGELVDSVNVWGDVNSSGRYLVPEGTNLPDLISFSLGYTQPRERREGSVSGGKHEVEIKVSRFDNSDRVVEVAYFRYRNHDPEPIELFEFDLQNNDIVTVKISRVPTFTDYVSVIAPILGTLATSILLIERLRGD